MRRSVGGGGNNGGNAAGRRPRRVPSTIDRALKLSMSCGTTSAGHQTLFGARKRCGRHGNDGCSPLAGSRREKSRFRWFLWAQSLQNRTAIDRDSAGPVGVGENR
ncbi:unnamed protein product [Macrosiphum euphorbiae]|uniref:Uncharacterized protein n=1 Tax=Macrosiphum euphorbiae TaxID=13131 RepID=A0AAV0X8Q8_9HEMI|nr:unnamed protein product [Macrosiphum euphorbiae]